MTSLTNFYIKLQDIYKIKAQKDIDIFKNIIKNFDLKKKISDEEIKIFCENCLTLDWINYSELNDEYKNPKEINCYENDCYKWYIAIKGVQEFIIRNKHVPTVIINIIVIFNQFYRL